MYSHGSLSSFDHSSAHISAASMLGLTHLTLCVFLYRDFAQCVLDLSEDKGGDEYLTAVFVFAGLTLACNMFPFIVAMTDKICGCF